MSVKIKISYTDDQELARVIQLLSPVLRRYKTSNNQEGKYKKAYIELSADFDGSVSNVTP